MPRNSTSLHFLFYALTDLDLGSLGSDSAVPGLNREMAYLSDLVVPAESQLRAFDQIVEPIRSKQECSNVENDTLSKLRDTLLPKLISGELPIKNAEKFLEQAGV